MKWDSVVKRCTSMQKNCRTKRKPNTIRKTRPTKEKEWKKTTTQISPYTDVCWEFWWGHNAFVIDWRSFDQKKLTLNKLPVKDRMIENPIQCLRNILRHIDYAAWIRDCPVGLRVSGQYGTSWFGDLLRGLVPAIWRSILLDRVMMMTIHRQLTIPDTISHSFLRVWSLPIQVNKGTGKQMNRSTVYR